MNKASFSKQLSVVVLIFFAYISLFLLSGCVAIPSSKARLDIAKQLAADHGWQAKLIKTAPFDLMSYVPLQHQPGTILTVYIEGDGFAWQSRSKPSFDPTPVNPIGLKLALAHPSGNASYLARPCQYMNRRMAGLCNKSYWTNKRFSEEIIVASNQAVDTLKTQFGASILQLVGYSGGGAIAALLAARRDDVVKLITVAGNLNHQAWTSLHGISPLLESLNPANYRQQLAKVEQIHYVGLDDKVMPPFLAQNFVNDLSVKAKAKVIIIPNQNHGCCWASIWTALMLQQCY